MHKTLLNFDILVTIVEFVESRNDLASLIVTCKHLERPVRARLWRSIPHASIFARLMPTHTSVETQDGDSPGYFDRSPESLKRLVDESDWIGDRFKLYAQHVQKLNVNTGVRPSDPSHFYQVPRTILSAWATYAQFYPLFPYLRQLCQDLLRPDEQLINLWLLRALYNSPGLQKLYIIIPDDRPRLSGYMLEDLAKLSGKLQCLTIKTLLRRNSTAAELSKVLQNSSVLTSFTTDILLGAEEIRLIASLPMLKHLKIFLQGDPSEWQISKGKTFLSLETLRIVQARGEWASIYPTMYLVKSVTSTALAEVHLFTMQFKPSVPELGEMSAFLAQSPARGQLREIEYGWGADTVFETTQDSVAILDDVILKLVDLPALEKLTLPQGCFSIRSAEHALRFLPLLETHIVAQMRVPVTLTALRTILAQRPISIPPPRCLVLLVAGETDFRGPAPPMPQVRSLHIMAHIRIGRLNGNEIAKGMRACFPSLAQIISMDTQKPLAHTWQQISKCLGVAFAIHDPRNMSST